MVRADLPALTKADQRAAIGPLIRLDWGLIDAAGSILGRTRRPGQTLPIGSKTMISGLDHLVLTVASIDATCEFYSKALGIEIVTFGQGRKALSLGLQKINLHQVGSEFEPKAKRPTPGCGDFCLISEVSIERIADHLVALGIRVEEGPVARTGAAGPIRSIYLRDPDENLVEVSNYVQATI